MRDDQCKKDDGPSGDIGDIDDGVIAERVVLPQGKFNLNRSLITLIVVSVIVLAYRFLSGTPGTFGEYYVTGADETKYFSGELVEVSFDEANSKVVTAGNGTVKVYPGTSLKVLTPGDGESSKFELSTGRLLVDIPVSVKPLVMTSGPLELSTGAGRMTIETWGQENEYILRLGVIEGSASVKDDEDNTRSVSAGDAVSWSPESGFSTNAPPIKKWHPVDRKLDRLIFPNLIMQDHPTVAEYLVSICAQAGFKADVPTASRLSTLGVPEELRGQSPVKADEMLDMLALRYGFQYGTPVGRVAVAAVDEAEHLAMLGEWYIFNHPTPDEFIWPEGLSSLELGRYQERLEEIFTLSSAPIENRIGALVALISARRQRGVGYDGEMYGSMLDILFDSEEPWVIRKLILDELYGDKELPPEKVEPYLAKSDIDLACGYFLLRPWGGSTWASDAASLDLRFKSVIDSDKDPLGQMILALYEGGMDTSGFKTIFESALGSIDDPIMVRDVTYFLRKVAVDAVSDIDLTHLTSAFNRILTMGQASLSIPALDGVAAVSRHAGRDESLMQAVRDEIENGTELGPLAAWTIGVMMQSGKSDTDEPWINQLAVGIADPASEGGTFSLNFMGRVNGLDISPGASDQRLINALVKRVTKDVDPDDLLLSLRILKSHRDVEGMAFAWVGEDAASALAQVLSSTDPNYLVEAIVTLRLDSAIEANASDELRDVLNASFERFVSHTDPRLRWLSLGYMENNNPPFEPEALEALVEDEYPAIADKAALMMEKLIQ